MRDMDRLIQEALKDILERIGADMRYAEHAELQTVLERFLKKANELGRRE